MTRRPVSTLRRTVLHSCRTRKGDDRAGRRLCLASRREVRNGLLNVGGVQELLPGLVFRQLRQFERDRFGGGIQDDENRRLPLLEGAQHIREKPAFGKIPVLLL